jgi:hypothetical protein
MKDDELRRAYATWLERRPTAGRVGCVSPEALLAVVERRGAEPERLATLDHTMACAECRRDLEVLRAIAVAGAGLGGGVARWRLSWMTAPGLRLAATVALMVAAGGAAMWLARRGGDTAAFRSGPGGDGVTAISPSGEVQLVQAQTMTWHRTAGALRYQVELLTLAGDSVFAASTADTMLPLPFSVALETGREYLWTVRAQLGDGTQAAAAPLRFRITP